MISLTALFLEMPFSTASIAIHESLPISIGTLLSHVSLLMAAKACNSLGIFLRHRCTLWAVFGQMSIFLTIEASLSRRQVNLN